MAANDTIHWYRTPIDRQTLRELTQKSDVKGLIQTLGYLGILAATGTAAALSVGRLPVAATVALVFLHGTAWAFMVNGFHELVHRTVFKSRALNEVFLRVLSFLGWLNPHLFYASHMKHHRYTLHPPKDGEVVLPISFTLKDYLLNAFVTPRGLYGIVRGTVRHAVGKLNNQWEEAIFPEDDPESRRKLVQWARILLLGHGAIVALSVAMGWWMLPLLVTLAPFYGRWLHVACNQTQHIGLVDDVDDYRLCCRTFAVNPVVRFVYWHMNYHTEHHMYAAVPCYNLHRAHKLVRHNLPPVPRGLIQTWREIGAILRKQRENPDYRYVAPVPPRLDG